MAKNVIIIESPGKIKKFQEYTGKGYKTVSSFGHVRDLPVHKFGVDIKKDFEPTWEIKEDKKDVVKSIQLACKSADNVYLMTDGDVEGEGISKHVYDLIKPTCKGNIYRATTNQITKAAIQEAISNPGQIDENKVNAYLARRILDRLVGYRTSFLTMQASGGRSAGRVQSAVLRIIVDREIEIINFHPVEYWILTAYLITKKGEQYTAVLTEKIEVPNEEKATEIYDKCTKSSPFISSVEFKEVKSYPSPPFTTLPMIATASSIFGWAAEKVMNVAQGLYTNGFCTYHRTDSPFIAPEAISSIRNYIQQNMTPNYLPSSAIYYKAKEGAQEAHECCRPTDITQIPTNVHLDGDDKKLYELIWKRAVACQMTPALDRRLKVVTDIGGYDFVSNGHVELFDGYRKCWDYGSSEDVVLPDLKKDDKVDLKNITKSQHFTEPKPRYTDSSLAKFCEKQQITRPATVATVFKTLKDRGYTTKKKNTFYPTEIGMAVVDFLKKSDMCFINIEFTAQLEDLLDEIQLGKKTETEVLKQFWERLKIDIENGKKIKNQLQVSEYKCPKCSGNLLKKHSNFGAFYSCVNWKKSKKGEKSEGCDYIAKVGEHGEPVEKIAKVIEYADFVCEKCDGKMIKRSSKKTGDCFYGCENFFKNGCRCTADLEGNFKEVSDNKKVFKKFFKKKS